MRKKFFKEHDGPPPIQVSCTRMVRFEECDPMGIMWHGRYPSFLEDSREELGAMHGISYTDFYKYNISLPIKHMYIDYIKPLLYKNTYTINCILHWCQSAKINIEYEICDCKNEITTRGYTVQLMADMNHNLLLEVPTFYADFREKWETGNL